MVIQVIAANVNRQQVAQAIAGNIIMKMKKSEEITSPASFLKKQSHIITNNAASPDYYYPTTRHEHDKQMHRSHFQSQANSTKFIEDTYFDQPEAVEKYSEGKGKAEEERASHKKDLLGDKSNHNLESFCQSDQMSSEQENSQTKSQKKFGLSSYNFSQKVIKRVASNDCPIEDKFLYIDSRKQKQNNKYLTLSDVEALQEQIKKYQASIDKLKHEHQRLRSDKFKLSNDAMPLVELRLQHEALKRKVRQLETEKEMHLSIDAHQQKTATSQSAPFTPNISNTPNTTNISNTPNASSTPNISNTPNVSSTPNVSNTPNTPIVSSTPNTPNVPNTAHTANTPNTGYTASTPNTGYTASTPNTGSTSNMLNNAQYGSSYMSASCLQNNSKRSDKEEMGKRNIPTFRNNQGKEEIEGKSVKLINSPRACMPEPDPKANYKILQNMKSPYFLKKN